ncbi:glycosylhydrolase-like jelly roll fold domain-containing protein [Aliiglaciecola sp. SL4]|uniref:glycosylhydrolase-like jelly roll fold domain-containing protein n=1 Tax=Aliiglaciecola sp. SL4 TaxID=3239806 RepID=UPI00355B5B75
MFTKSPVDGNDLYFHDGSSKFRQINVDICGDESESKEIPEIWDNTDSPIEQIQNYRREGNSITFDLALESYAIRFILVHRDIKTPIYNGTYSQLVKGIYENSNNEAQVSELTGPWKVEFDPAWAGPGVVNFDNLRDWTARAEKGIKHYSGTANYALTFTISQAQVASNKSI